MHRIRFRPQAFLAGCAVAFCLLAGAAVAQTFPVPPQCPNESLPFTSLGAFKVWVADEFRDLVSAEPGWDGSTNIWTSLTMADLQTTIGHSCAHEDGDAADTGGTQVGSTAWLDPVSDSDFGSFVPTSGFTDGPASTREVHTEILKLNLVEATCKFVLRAGIGAGVSPRSLGEVESTTSDPTNDFPAESFFLVYFELDTPFFGNSILYNKKPVALVGSDLKTLPPKTLYLHNESEAVPVYFKDGSKEGELFGQLLLAGHGAQFRCFGGNERILFPDCPDNPLTQADFAACTDSQEVFATLDATAPMPCPDCVDEAPEPKPWPWLWILIVIIVVLLIVILVLVLK